MTITRNKINPNTKEPYQEKVLKQKMSTLSSPVGPSEKDEMDLDKLHRDYDCLDPCWQYLADCYEGGGAVQDAVDDKYLIKRSNEKQKKYDVRKRDAVYYNKCAQIVSTFQGHLWRRDPERSLPPAFDEMMGNVDRQGKNANKFFSFVTEWAQTLGIYYVLPEFPYNPNLKETDKQSVADEKALGLRPYFSLIDPRNVLDWGFYTAADGSRKLSFVVIKEKRVQFNVPFFPAEDQDQYRVLYPKRQEIWVWQKVSSKKRKAVMLGEPIPVTLGEIPLVPFYSKEKKYGVGVSALYDIARLCIELFNKHSSRSYAEMMSAFPLLFLAGWSTAEPIIISEDHALISEDTSAKAQYIEFLGSSIEALRTAERDIVSEIFDLAMKQVRNTSNQRETAEAKRMDRLDALSDLQARAVGFSHSEEMCWKYVAKWLKMDDSEISVSYNLDYDIDKIKADLIGKLLDMRALGDLSRQTLWEILKQGEVMQRNFDPEEEKERLATEEQESLPFEKNVTTPEEKPKEGTELPPEETAE